MRAGPTCVRQLADWGANVIKIETPARRRRAMGGPREGCDFQNLHRNKRSMTLNLKAPEGLAAFKRMVKKADVVVENYRPDVKERLGIDYKALAKINPRIVYASISGFGQDGPYADRPGFDQIAQGMGGLMSITGLPGQGPVRVGIPVADLSAGLFAATAFWWRCWSGRSPARASGSRPRCCRRRFPCWTSRPRASWSRAKSPSRPATIIRPAFRPACSRPRTATSTSRQPGRTSGSASARRSGRPRCCTTRTTSGRRKALEEPRRAQCRNRQAIMEERTSAEWVERLNAAGVPCGPIYAIDQMFADPQVKHLGIAQSVTKKDKSKMRLVAQAVTLSRTPSKFVVPPPELGEHTDAVLKEFGFGKRDIAALHKAKAV